MSTYTNCYHWLRPCDSKCDKCTVKLYLSSLTLFTALQEEVLGRLETAYITVCDEITLLELWLSCFT